MSGAFFDVELAAPLGRFALDYRLATDARQVGVFGPSGAGKTMVLEHVAGWRRGGRGRVVVGGRALADSERGLFLPPRRRGIGYVPQDGLLFPHWSVRENLAASRRSGGHRPDAALVERVLGTLELGELRDRPVRRLSGGEKRRVALGRALCSRPELLLLDEPLAGLDLPLKRRILSDLVRAREELALPMLVVSHDPTEVQVLCELVQVVRDGRVVAEGPPAAVLGAAEAGDVRAEYENVLRGRVAEAEGDVAWIELERGPRVVVPRSGAAAGERVVVAVRADDVIAAREEPRGLSARNVLAGRVEGVDAGAESVALRVRLGEEEGAPSVVASLTRGALGELGLAVGDAAHLVVKTRSFHVLARW